MTRSRSPTRSKSLSRTSEGSLKPVASPVSSTRSAARATYSAYKRQPIRWRLAGGSAALTLVILCGFAVIVGTLTTRAIYKDFNRQVAASADKLGATLSYTVDGTDRNGNPRYAASVNIENFAAGFGAAIRVVDRDGHVLSETRAAPDFGEPQDEPQQIGDWKVETRTINVYTSPPYGFRARV